MMSKVTKIGYWSFLFIAGMVMSSFGQEKLKRDTVYYVLDTLKIPPKDRMITVKKEKSQVFFTIECACLANHNKPVFRSNVSKQIYVDSLKFASISFKELIELVRKNDDEKFDSRFVIFFIEASKKGYLKQRVFFLGGYTNKIN